MLFQEEKLLYIRKAVPRKDIDKVIGKVEYIADLEIPGVLWMKLVGSQPACQDPLHRHQ